MKNQQGGIIFLLGLVSLLLPGCSVIGGIFKAGVWSGIFVVVIILVVILVLINRARK